MLFLAWKSLFTYLLHNNPPDVMGNKDDWHLTLRLGLTLAVEPSCRFSVAGHEAYPVSQLDKAHQELGRLVSDAFIGEDCRFMSRAVSILHNARPDSVKNTLF
jgi:hypothetical protein